MDSFVGGDRLVLLLMMGEGTSATRESSGRGRWRSLGTGRGFAHLGGSEERSRGS